MITIIPSTIERHDTMGWNKLLLHLQATGETVSVQTTDGLWHHDVVIWGMCRRTRTAGDEFSFSLNSPAGPWFDYREILRLVRGDVTHQWEV